MPASSTLASYRFGPFHLDVRAYRLRYHGRPVRLERRPMDLLLLLVERRGELVTRPDIVERLWEPGVFVDVETGVNTAIWKLRAALRDSPDTRRYIETVPGKGYRFIADVEIDDAVTPSSFAPGSALTVTGDTDSDHSGRPAPPSPTVATESAAASSAAPSPSAGPARWWGRAPAVRHPALLVLVAVAISAAAYLGHQSVAPESVVLAVLPFESATDDPGQAYLAQGLGDETIASLSKIAPQRLTVVPKTTVMAYIRGGRTPASMARDLGVDFLVEGEVAGEDGIIRMTSRLLEADTQSQVWSASFRRERSSLRALHRDVSVAIADHVRVSVGVDRLTALDRRQTQNPEAYETYLRARYFENQRNRASTARAVQYYEQAITLDPAYALAWAGLSFTLAASAINSDTDPQQVRERARIAAENAINVNPDLAEAQFAFGYVQWLLEWNWRAAEVALRRAIALDSSHVTAHRTLGHVLSQMGAHADAERSMAHTRARDPFSPMTHALSAQVAFQARDLAAARQHARRATLVDSQFWIGHMQLAQAYVHAGETGLALESLADAARFSGGENSKTMAFRGYLMGRLGRTVEAEEALRALAEASTTRYVPPSATALVHAGMGNTTAVFEWLERAFTARDVNLIFLPSDAVWDPYRRDERFALLLTRCGFLTNAR